MDCLYQPILLVRLVHIMNNKSIPNDLFSRVFCNNFSASVFSFSFLISEFSTASVIDKRIFFSAAIIAASMFFVASSAMVRVILCKSMKIMCIKYFVQAIFCYRFQVSENFYEIVVQEAYR